MKKYIKIIIPLVVLSLLVFIGYKVSNKINHKKEIAERIKTMPSFEYKTLENSTFNNDNLSKNKATVFIYFNTECDFCNEEAIMIKQNINKFNSVQLLFISFENTEKIKVFAQKHKLLGYDNVTFIFDSKATFSSTFDVKSIPSLVIYDNNKQLIKILKGQTKINKIIRLLNPPTSPNN
ncbi:redoxin domain-containing protein [Flavobacterium sp.]|uniref:peroxiredoxin family protein n=1 Tax=Flavobacterium sp. TaxID=239 RepID=UPI00286DFBC4|nr:redoxin domain-containing protein [Flavobacterium sp.]